MEDSVMSIKKIVIGTDFSDTPSGRYRDDGPFSGEVFRDDLLVPALKENEKVCVDISGVEGYGSSFLEEVFGGLVRLGIYTKSELTEKLRCEATDKSKKCYLERINAYMESAWGKHK